MKYPRITQHYIDDRQVTLQYVNPSDWAQVKAVEYLSVEEANEMLAQKDKRIAELEEEIQGLCGNLMAYGTENADLKERIDGRDWRE